MLTAETVDSALNLCREKKNVLCLQPLRSLEPCQTCWEGSYSRKNEQCYSRGRQILMEMYLGGLWRCTHGLRVGCAVVCCLLTVVFCPGSAVVWLSSRLRSWGCCSSWSLRCRLTWNVKQNKVSITNTLKITKVCFLDRFVGECEAAGRTISLISLQIQRNGFQSEKVPNHLLVG